MLHVSRFTKIIVALILIVGIMLSLPNALPENIRTKMPSWLPHDTVSLGLDLQGGSYILLEVQLDPVLRDKVDMTVGELRRSFRKAHIGYTDLASTGDGLSLRILDPGQYEEARAIVKAANPSTGNGVIGASGRQYEMAEAGDQRIQLTMTDAYKKQTKHEIVAQSIETVRRRIDELGTKEPSIEQQGDDRIVVQVPGLQDPSQLISILKTTAKMTFQLVDENADQQAAQRGNVPIGDELLDMDEGRLPNGQAQKIVVQRRVLVAGDRLKKAGWSTDQRTGQVVVTFSFDTVGARQFGDVTKENVNKRFAIVLDKKVLTAPNIREPILQGSGQIDGNFTIKSAQELSAMLNAGALPAPLKPIEMRTVGPELGADQIRAGRDSAIAGLICVAFFIFLRYGMFGMFANVALVFNVVLLLAVLTMFGATLTLPGIAGIVLTMGMAVDANVLIFERMREEHRNGRGMLASIDTGERRAMATIIDANATHLIAALILFELGSGPVRGFAVTLGIGIISSFFTAVMVVRLIILWWLHVAKPKQLII
jgi:protein-export membrane protein SecD